jgi:disulfide bond formation protein DsbB
LIDMDNDTVATFLALLSLLCWAGVVVVVAAVAIAKVRPHGWARALLDAIAPSALWLAWLVAAVATAGSLWLSEGAGYVPCELCWYQRICMYALPVILLIAAVRRDRDVRWYVLPQVIVGALIAGYHTQLQAFPEQKTFCSTTVPCTVRYIWEFGFVSIPFMALAAFSWILVMVLLARPDLDPKEAP